MTVIFPFYKLAVNQPRQTEKHYSVIEWEDASVLVRNDNARPHTANGVREVCTSLQAKQSKPFAKRVPTGFLVLGEREEYFHFRCCSAKGIGGLKHSACGAILGRSIHPPLHGRENISPALLQHETAFQLSAMRSG